MGYGKGKTNCLSNESIALPRLIVFGFHAPVGVCHDAFLLRVSIVFCWMLADGDIDSQAKWARVSRVHIEIEAA